MEYFSCLLSPERCPPHFNKKCLRLDGLHQLHRTWQISGRWSHSTQKLFGEEVFFFPAIDKTAAHLAPVKTKFVLLLHQVVGNHICLLLFLFPYSVWCTCHICSVCPEKHQRSVQFNFQNCNKCVFFPFTLHSSSEESFIRFCFSF